MAKFQQNKKSSSKSKKRRQGRTNNISLINSAGRKKHVETRFNVMHNKKYPFYYRNRTLFKRDITNTAVDHNYNSDQVCYYTQEGGYMRMAAFKSVARLLKHFLKEKKIKCVSSKFHTFPDFVLTAKPKEVRMGKGKGTIASRVALMRGGQKILTLAGLSKIKPKRAASGYKLITKVCEKLPLKATYRRCF
jgi:ribosomal protein L16/L10AE